MLTPKTVEVVKATASVVAANAEAITRRFYQLMFAGNPEVRQYFNPAHQRAGTQQRALADAICAYAANIDNLAALQFAVELIAQKHCSLGIQAEHYPIVGKHLLQAIQDVLGDAVTEEIAAAWTEAYNVLATVFIEREKTIYELQLRKPGGWNGYRRFIVTRKVPESEIISSFYLAPEDGGALPAHKAGQYITVKIDHPEQKTSPRNYSLSDRAQTGHFRISVKRELGANVDSVAGVVSNLLHDQVKEGDVLEIGPPCGEFTLDKASPSERPVVFISGGIGITPLLAMLKELVHLGVQRRIYFVHAARNSRVHAFADELRQLKAACPRLVTHTRYDAPLENDSRAGHCDSAGRVDLEFLKKLLPSADADFFICGPKPFMTGLSNALEARGTPKEQVHVEFFGPKETLNVGKGHNETSRHAPTLATA